MVLEIAKWTLLAFGIFFIAVGGVMLFNPKLARETVRKAGSTNFINYAEITLRMIPAIAIVIYSDVSEHPEVFKIVGWFMLLTSFVLYFVPRKHHHAFANKAADTLKPIYFQLISPLSISIGVFILLAVQ